MIMQTDKNQRQLGFISPRRKQLEEQYRRLFEREDMAIDRLANHAQSAKYLSGKFQSKQRSINDLQSQLSSYRQQNQKLHRQNLTALKKHDAARLKIQTLELKIDELEEVSAERKRLEMDNMQLRLQLKKFQENLKQVVEKYEGEWQRTKQLEVQKEFMRNQQLTQSCRRLEGQLDKWKEKFEEAQKENSLKNKQAEQIEIEFKKQVRDANERVESYQQACQKLKKTLDQLRLQASKELAQKRALQQQVADLRSRLDSAQKFTQKMENQLKRQLQLKDQDLVDLQNEHSKALAEVSELIAQLQITRRVEKQISRVKDRDYREIRQVSPKPRPMPIYYAEENRRESRVNAGHISRVGIHSPQGRKFIQVLKRTRESTELPSSQVRVVSKILQKAKYIN